MLNVEPDALAQEIERISDEIEALGRATITHPNDNVKIFAASRLVDQEIAKRMAAINQRNKDEGFLVVGGVQKEN